MSVWLPYTLAGLRLSRCQSVNRATTSALVVLACVLGPGCVSIAQAATLNGFQVHLDNSVLNLKLNTDAVVSPEIQPAPASITGLPDAETRIFIPGAHLSPELQRNGPAMVMDTQGRFTAQAKAVSGGVAITLSNLQEKAFQLSVSQNRGGPARAASPGRFPLPAFSPPLLETGRTAYPTLGLHLVAPKPTLKADAETASQGLTENTRRNSILGQAPVVSPDALTAMNSRWGEWPFTTRKAMGKSMQSSVSNTIPQAGQTQQNEQNELSGASPIQMSTVGLLAPAHVPNLLPAQLAGNTSAKGEHTVQEVSIKPLLQELPIWLLPLLGFFLGGSGLLALTVTLVLVGATLRYWPRKLKAALQETTRAAHLPPPQTAELNVQHAQPKPQLPEHPPEPVTMPKRGFVQAPTLTLTRTVQQVAPPIPVQTVAEAIQRTSGRSYGPHRKDPPRTNGYNPRSHALRSRCVSMSIT